MLERFKKYDIGLVQANLAHTTIQDQKNTQQNSRFGRGNGGRRGCGRRGGRSWSGGQRP